MIGDIEYKRRQRFTSSSVNGYNYIHYRADDKDLKLAHDYINLTKQKIMKKHSRTLSRRITKYKKQLTQAQVKDVDSLFNGDAIKAFKVPLSEQSTNNISAELLQSAALIDNRLSHLSKDITTIINFQIELQNMLDNVFGEEHIENLLKAYRNYVFQNYNDTSQPKTQIQQMLLKDILSKSNSKQPSFFKMAGIEFDIPTDLVKVIGLLDMLQNPNIEYKQQGFSNESEFVQKLTSKWSGWCSNISGWTKESGFIYAYLGGNIKALREFNTKGGRQQVRNYGNLKMRNNTDPRLKRDLEILEQTFRQLTGKRQGKPDVFFEVKGNEDSGTIVGHIGISVKNPTITTLFDGSQIQTVSLQTSSLWRLIARESSLSGQQTVSIYNLAATNPVNDNSLNQDWNLFVKQLALDSFLTVLMGSTGTHYGEMAYYLAVGGQIYTIESILNFVAKEQEAIIVQGNYGRNQFASLNKWFGPWDDETRPSILYAELRSRSVEKELLKSLNNTKITIMLNVTNLLSNAK